MGPLTGAFEVGGHCLVGVRGRRGQMPRAPVLLAEITGRLCQRGVHARTPAEGCAVVDRRADQGVPEPHRLPDVQQPARLRRLGGLRVEPQLSQLVSDPPEQVRIAGGIRGCGEQQRLGVGRQGSGLAQVELFQGPAQRHRVGQRRIADQLGRTQLPSRLDERERVATGRGDDPRAHAEVQSTADDRGEQAGRRRVGQAGESEVRQSREMVHASAATSAPSAARQLARGEHHSDRVGVQAPGDERQDVGGLLVQPVRVVDHAEQRPRVGARGEQRQRGEADEEPVRRQRVLLEAEDQPQRVALRDGQCFEAAQQRTQQLVQRRETELGLGLHAVDAHDVETLGLGVRVVEQRRLPGPRVAAQHEHAAQPLAGQAQDLAQALALLITAEQFVHSAKSTDTRYVMGPLPRPRALRGAGPATGGKG